MSCIPEKEGNNHHKESWDDFQKHVENFIDNKFISGSKVYHLILGFPRGGLILANIISCMLKDNKEDYYLDNTACVRPIPGGIYSKNKEPCFLMNNNVSQEKYDIETYLEDDIVDFWSELNKSITEKIDRSKYSDNKSFLEAIEKINPPQIKKLNLLIVDDNLTTANRLIFVCHELLKIKTRTKILIENIEVLSYTINLDSFPACIDLANDKIKIDLEHECEELTFNMIYPLNEKQKLVAKNEKIFIMPWHVSHIIKILKNFENTSELSWEWELLFENCDRNIFSTEFENICSWKKVKLNGDVSFITNNFNCNYIFAIVKKTDTSFMCKITVNNFLPPSDCLVENNEEFVTPFQHSLCECGVPIDPSNCLLCTIFNCNTEFTEHLVKYRNDIKLTFPNHPELSDNLKKWIQNILSR